MTPSADDWPAWLELSRNERVLPLLALLTRQSASVTAAEIEAADEAHVGAMSSAVHNEFALIQVVDTLNRLGIKHAVLKGVAVSHLDYRDPSLRQFGDVDLLVEPDRFGDAIVSLEETGWTQAYSLPRHHEAFTHAITLRSPTSRAEIDLHQRIAHRALGLLVPATELLDRSIPLDLYGRSTRALSSRDRLIHASLHWQASQGGYRRLSSAADVVLLSGSQVGDAAGVLADAERWSVRPLVEAGLRSAWAEAQLDVPGEWHAAMARPIHRRDRLVERAYLSGRRRPALEELACLRRMTGIRSRFRYLTGYLATDDAYAAQHGRRGLVQQARYLGARLTGRRGT